MLLKERLGLLRKQLQQRGLTAYVISSADEFLSEYSPKHAKRLEYITGFTGSNGLAIITLTKVIFFTDGRYLTQAESQFDNQEFEIYDQRILKTFQWHKYFTNSDFIGYDPKIFSYKMIGQLPSSHLKVVEENLIDLIWQDKPLAPNSKVYEYPIKYAGIDYKQKIALCRSFLQEHKASALLVSDPHAVCWLLNIRAHDLEFTPILLANALITEHEIYLFCDPKRIDSELAAQRSDVKIVDQTEFEKVSNEIKGKILFDANLASCYVLDWLKKREHLTIIDPCQRWKAIKNKTELDSIKLGHIQDAAAICEFLSFIESAPSRLLEEPILDRQVQGVSELCKKSSDDLAKLTEYDLGLLLTDFRSKRQDYVMDSFPAICGYQENGAIIHYRAEKNSAKKLSGSGLLLVDSGGQYMGATTDITRTIAIGNLSSELNKYKAFYTKVLRGHLALAMVKFPSRLITGAHLDILARQYLWQAGLDYNHGTGHGVGSFLSVHEGPHSISLAGFTAIIEDSMVMSNEPGYYLPNEFGIRIENLMYAKKSDVQGFSEFEMLTLVPYCKSLIDFDSLTTVEMSFLKTYYSRIKEFVRPLLSKNASIWLDEQLDIS